VKEEMRVSESGDAETTAKSATICGSSVGKKQIMAITGLSLVGFVFVHLAGNLLLYAGPELFKKYSYALTSTPLIYVAEAGLVALFIAHIGMAIKLTLENKAARPQTYYMKTKTGAGSTLASSTMPYSGIAILIFMIIHLIGIKYGTVYMTSVDGVEMRDVYRLVIEVFQSPVNVAVYVVAVSLLGLHLSHGFWSAFQSLGIYHSKYSQCLRCAAKVIGAVVALGYAALPIWAYVVHGGLL